MERSSHFDRYFLTKIHDALLNDWDPIGVAEYPQAHDEYDAYVTEVFQLLTREPCFDEVFQYLWDLETRHIGLTESQFRQERTSMFAEQLLKLSEEMRDSRNKEGDSH